MKNVHENDPSSLIQAKRQKKTSTAAKTISDLPYHVLEKILELAVGIKKSAGMLNASLVCKTWNRFISESPRIMSVLSPTVLCTAEPVIINPISFELNDLEMFVSSECILDWMNCKKLKTFEYFAPDALEHPNTSTIQFLNRLEHLNELIFNSYSWKSKVPELKPKFMWKKLKLQIACNTDQISNLTKFNMIALGRASAADGEAHIQFFSDWLNNSQESDFTIDFLNDCKKIKTLELKARGYDKSIKAYLSSLRMMDEVETFGELQCNFKDAEGLIGLKSLLDKMPNLKDLTLDLRTDGDDAVPAEDDNELVNDPINIQLKNLEKLAIRPPMTRRGRGLYGFDSTEMFWKTFSFGSSLKKLEVSSHYYLKKWHSTNEDGELDEEFSPIRLYKDWVSAENRSSVESCILKLTRDVGDPSRGMKKTRDEVELEFFGRLLNSDEKKFFSQIIIDGCED